MNTLGALGFTRVRSQDVLVPRWIRGTAEVTIVGNPPRPLVATSLGGSIGTSEEGLEAPVIRVGNLDTRRDMTDVRDAVEAYVLMMRDAPAGRPYNICSGRAWKIGDLLEELLHFARRPITVAVDEQRLRPNDVPVVQGDASRIRAELGWEPKIPVEQTLSDTLEWWRTETLAGR